MLSRVFAEVYRKLVTGRRACINVANIGRKPYIPLHAMITEIMRDLGFLMHGENYLGQVRQWWMVLRMGKWDVCFKSGFKGLS